jgi:eukaryotic-like serine/threonine-protein kinase
MSRDQRHLGEYELRERLGSGPTGEVWKAFDLQRQRPIALKILHVEPAALSDFTPRFLREVQRSASLHHPNIAPVLDFQITHATDSDQPIAYIATEYIEGSTLADYILRTWGRGNSPPIAPLLQLFTAICRALEYAYQHGIVHGDLKPTNILLADSQTDTAPPFGIPMLTDFGLATIMGPSLTNPPNMLYTSPEQVQGIPGNERSDIYSLGVILYQLCTGILPFRGGSSAEIMMQRLYDPPTAPALIHPTIPPSVTMVLLRGLSIDPQARFPKPMSMATAFAKALSITSTEIDITNELTHPSIESTSSLPAVSLSNVQTHQVAEAASTSVSNTRPLAPSSSGITRPPLSGDISKAPGGVHPALLAPTILPSTSRPQPSPQKRRRWLIPLVIGMVTILLLSAALGTFYLFLQRNTGTTELPVVGYAFFVSSGQLSDGSNQGMNDELLVDLHNLPPPASGKHYYAWLLGDKRDNGTLAILLATLTLDHGKSHFLYKDKGHHNLLATAGRFLITEENANPPPTVPSSDLKVWRYYAELSQTPAPHTGDEHRLSPLDYLRYLLSSDPELDALQLHGGLNFWLSKNTKKVFESAISARDDWNSKSVQLMHDQFIRILDYLDGPISVQTDVDPGTPLLVNSQVALLDRDAPQSGSPGYVTRIAAHLQDMLKSPGVSAEQRHVISDLQQDLSNMKARFQQVRQDAMQLEHMPGTALLFPSSLSLLDDMTAQALYAYIGRLAPDTNQVQGGAVQIGYGLQHLSRFDIRSANSHH